jgi:putative NIF3 family GTP cyclohydrolase 1 type 2
VLDEVDIKELAENEAEKLDSSYKIYGPGGKVSKVGIISGGAGEKGILAAVNEGLDCLITGEFGHTSWHLVKELGISVIACGHYKTEIPGIKALQEALDTFFDIETEFIDIPTGL